MRIRFRAIYKKYAIFFPLSEKKRVNFTQERVFSLTVFVGISCGTITLTFSNLNCIVKIIYLFIYLKNALSNEYELRDQNITKTLAHYPGCQRFSCAVSSVDHVYRSEEFPSAAREKKPLVPRKLPQWKNVCQGVPRDQPQLGPLSSTTREATKRDPENEVVTGASTKSSRKSFIVRGTFNEGKATRHEWI